MWYATVFRPISRYRLPTGYCCENAPLLPACPTSGTRPTRCRPTAALTARLHAQISSEASPKPLFASSASPGAYGRFQRPNACFQARFGLHAHTAAKNPAAGPLPAASRTPAPPAGAWSGCLRPANSLLFVLYHCPGAQSSKEKRSFPPDSSVAGSRPQIHAAERPPNRRLEAHAALPLKIKKIPAPPRGRRYLI